MSFIGFGFEAENIDISPTPPAVICNAGYLIDHEKWYFLKKGGDDKIKDFDDMRTHWVLLTLRMGTLIKAPVYCLVTLYVLMRVY